MLKEDWTRTHASESDNPVITCKKYHALCFFEAVFFVSEGSVFVGVASAAACKESCGKTMATKVRETIALDTRMYSLYGTRVRAGQFCVDNVLLCREYRHEPALFAI